MSSVSLKLLSALGALAVCGAAHAAEVERTYAAPNARFASTITVPASAEMVYLSGTLSPPSDALPGGDRSTEAQTEAVLKSIEATLKTQGLSFADVVSMHVFLVGDPTKGGVMDFAGMNAAYGRAFGTPTQPNRPVRSTVQVSALAAPGSLVEIEVVAARTKH
ncbi:MAG TPA: Rid family hydrolase [Caulobacteraceae bacterium]|jgi:enamine deaminase RidA (YjgF/YER057c/UK114 family)